MQEFNDFNLLQEGISPLLFHITSIKSLYEMLSGDRLFLRPLLRSMADTVADPSGISSTGKGKVEKLFFLSTARTMHSQYIDSSFDRSRAHVVLELDGRLLSTRYSGNPLDYWGKDFRNMLSGKYEQEDRIYHTEPYIPNATKYIKAIHIHMPQTYIDKQLKENDNMKKFISGSLLVAKRKGVPVHFYNDKATFFSRRNPVNFDVSALKRTVEPFSSSIYREDRNNTVLVARGLARFMTEVEDVKTMDKVLDEPTKKWLRNNMFKTRGDLGQTVQILFNDLSDVSISTDASRDAAKQLAKVMSKYHMRSPSDFGELIINKYIKLTRGI